MGKRWKKWRAAAFDGWTLEELHRLKDACSGSVGPTDVEMYRTAVNLIWNRSSEPVKSWPTYTDHGTTLVGFCGEGSSPDDPDHQPVRRVCYGSNRWLECKCGARESDALHSFYARRWRTAQAPHNWLRADAPEMTLMHLRIENLVPASYLICKYAKSLDDRMHACTSMFPGSAPGTGTMRALFQCICGTSSYDDEVLCIPVEDSP
jgi:hypothetical protein